MSSLKELRKYCSEEVVRLNPDLFAADAPKPEAKRNKYGATKTNFEGIVFDSAKEARRYSELRVLQMGMEIADLRTQVQYILQDAIVDGAGKKQRPITYTADFVYVQDGVTIIEDCKSVATARTESFRVRWRLLLNRFKDDPSVQCVIFGA